MYQEVCFNRGTEARGGGGGELKGATCSARQSFYACYGPDIINTETFLSFYKMEKKSYLNSLET